MTTVPGATATTSTSSTAATTAAAQQSLAGDQQTFLTLLTTQLKNQDPLSPVDSNQFTQQLVAMTGVQQQITTNTLLQQLVDNQAGLGDSVGLIGKLATATTPTTTLQNGQANWLFSLNGTAANATLQVLDSGGNLVWQGAPNSLSPGEQSFTWNGQNLSGVQQPDGGTYTLQITAGDSGGGAVTSQIYQRGVVTSIQGLNGTTMVGMNGAVVPLSSVTGVTSAS